MSKGIDTLALKVTRVEAAASDAVIVYLEALNNDPIEYEAGQFLTFLFDQNGREMRRSYSICTTPQVDEGVAVVIKSMVNGAISRWLVTHLKVGDVLEALPPAGRFTLPDPVETGTLIFIAAGSGITPVFSLVKKALFLNAASRVVLIYQNRDEASAIFLQELQMLEESFSGRLVMLLLFSNPGRREYIARRLNNALLEVLLRPYTDERQMVTFYICGPGSFMRMAQFVIRSIGFSIGQIKKENFTIDPPPPPPLLSDRSPKNVQLRWKEREYHFTVTYPVNILQAALNNHIHLPYSCRGGRCSTCTVKCVSGTVKMSINEVLTDKDLAHGLCLTCVGFAETDLVLEV